MKKMISKSLVFFFIVIISTACSTSGKSINVTDEMNSVISEFILDYNKDKYYETEKQFEAHKVYGAKEIDGIVEVYIYSLYMGFNRVTKDEEQSGGSFPVLIKLKNKNDTYSVIEYKEPENGDMYTDSIKEMFPKKYANKAIKDTRSVNKLEKKIKEKVDLWLEEPN
ncbi:hypothetical protein [Halalkalibacter lacteus]|uniref:hypothetical protein n=1 Tax=Halalkalibacter lacteus TaxID=3090663 RepID=UPI002FCCAE45